MLQSLAVGALMALFQIQPLPVDNPQWLARHDGFVQQARAGGINVLFLGDSITDCWRNTGYAVWNHDFVPMGAADFGIISDKIENLWWRVDHGEVDAIAPKAAVLLIGTNNLVGYSIEEIELGQANLINDLRARLPQTKLLVLGVFPRVDASTADLQSEIPVINQAMSGLADGKQVFYLDIGDKFRGPDGGISREIMFDGVHPTQTGYQIWSDAMMPTLLSLLR